MANGEPGKLRNSSRCRGHVAIAASEKAQCLYPQMKKTAHDQLTTCTTLPRRVIRVAFWILLGAGAVAVCFYREPLRNLVFTKGVMLNDAPTEEAIGQVLDTAKDRQAAIRAFWNTKKIVPREAAIRQLLQFIPSGEPIPAQMESWVLPLPWIPTWMSARQRLGFSANTMIRRWRQSVWPNSGIATRKRSELVWRI